MEICKHYNEFSDLFEIMKTGKSVQTPHNTICRGITFVFIAGSEVLTAVFREEFNFLGYNPV
jgi:hypothetical protein